MVKPLIRTVRKTSFTIVIVALALIIALLLFLLYSILVDIGTVDQQTRQYLITLASLVAAVLLLSIFLLVLEVVHYVAGRVSGSTAPTRRTDYEYEQDAWTEAGKRLKPEDAPPIEDFEQDDE